MRLLACLLLALALSACAQPRNPDWKKLEPEILETFTALLKIDTSNPPGNETQAANVIKAILEREGIPAKLFASDPARANLVARIKGTGSQAAPPHHGPHRRGRRAEGEVDHRPLRRRSQERDHLRPRHE